MSFMKAKKPDSTKANSTGKPASLASAYNMQKMGSRSAPKMTGEPKMMAQGGVARATSDADEHYDGIADAIMKKRMMAQGGEVEGNESIDDDMETSASPSPYNDANADLKEVYDTDQLSSYGDSGEIGDAGEYDEENQFDMVDRIRAKLKKKMG